MSSRPVATQRILPRLVFAAVFLVVFVGTLSPRATAESAPFVLVNSYRSGNLQVLGDGAAWTESRCLKGCADLGEDETDLIRFISRSSGGRRRVLASGRASESGSGADFSFDDVAFEASGTHLIEVETSSRSVSDGGEERRGVILTTPLGGVPRTPLSCAVDAPTVDLDGSTLAYDASQCMQGSRDVVVRSLLDGSIHRLPLGIDRHLVGRGLVLAGDRLAVLSAGRQSGPSELTLWGVNSGSKLAELTIPPGPSNSPPDIALRPDGTMAWVQASIHADHCRSGKLEVLDPGAPAPRTLTTGACDTALLGNTTAITRTTTKLIAVPLSGGTPHPLLDFGHVLPSDVSDMRDDRIAYALPTCPGPTAVYVAAATAQTVHAGPAGCQVRIPRQRLTVRPDHTFPVRVACPDGCHGRVDVSVGTAVDISKPIALGPGTHRIELRAPAAALARLRRNRSLTASIVVNAFDRDIPDSPHTWPARRARISLGH